MRTPINSLKSEVGDQRSAVCSLRSVVFSPRSSVSRGFTLIELLVAMGILMVIVLMMANLFKQSTIAWESGTRQAEVGLEARAVMGMIQHELSQAVRGTNDAFTASGGTLAFWTLAELPEGNNATNREAKWVEYSLSGSSGGVLKKGNKNLLKNVTVFRFATPASTNVPPAWVDVTLEVSAKSDVSMIRVYAEGRAYDPGNPDKTDVIDTQRY